jgi:hypothetical protein
MYLRRLAVLAVAGAAALSVGLSSASAVGSFTTVVAGLDNPRDLSFSPNGKLYVAEAGSGGPDCVAGGPEGTTCAGFTSGISVIDLAAGTAHRVVTGLASTSGAGGFGAIGGVDGISFHGNGTLYAVLGESSDGVPAGLPANVTAGLKAELGRLIQVNPSGNWKVISDVGHADFQWTADNQFLVPDQFPDSNPYGVLGTPAGAWVVNAAANTIDRVDRNGSVSSRTFIPNPPVSDAVPTCIDQGPDGALYVGQLTGVGNGAGAASIWRFDPATGDLSKWATGLSAITGCGFGADGNFYAVEFSNTSGFNTAGPGDGVVVRVPPHSASPTVIVDGLSMPGGFAAGPDGSLYVSNWSVAPASTGLGSVIRITP